MTGDPRPQLPGRPALPPGGVPGLISVLHPLQLALPGVSLPLDGPLYPLPVLLPELGNPRVPLLPHPVHPLPASLSLVFHRLGRTVREGGPNLGDVEEAFQNLVGHAGLGLPQISGKGIPGGGAVQLLRYLRDMQELVHGVVFPRLVEKLRPHLGQLLVHLINIGVPAAEIQPSEVPPTEVAVVWDVCRVLLRDGKRGGAQILPQRPVFLIGPILRDLGALYHPAGNLVRPAAGLGIGQLIVSLPAGAHVVIQGQQVPGDVGGVKRGVKVPNQLPGRPVHRFLVHLARRGAPGLAPPVFHPLPQGGVLLLQCRVLPQDIAAAPDGAPDIRVVGGGEVVHPFDLLRVKGDVLLPRVVDPVVSQFLQVLPGLSPGLVLALIPSQGPVCRGLVRRVGDVQVIGGHIPAVSLGVQLPGAEKTALNVHVGPASGAVKHREVRIRPVVHYK